MKITEHEIRRAVKTLMFNLQERDDLELAEAVYICGAHFDIPYGCAPTIVEKKAREVESVQWEYEKSRYKAAQNGENIKKESL